MYENAARVHFGFAGTSKKSEMLYIIYGKLYMLYLDAISN